MEINREETVTQAVKNKTAFYTELVKHREKMEKYVLSHSKFWYRLFGTDLRKISFARDVSVTHTSRRHGDGNTMVIPKRDGCKIQPGERTNSLRVYTTEPMPLGTVVGGL
jgi:hypothetical protein